jgi:hypothetical protein
MDKVFDFIKRRWFGISIFGIAIMCSGALFVQSNRLGMIALAVSVGIGYLLLKVGDLGFIMPWLDEDPR